MAILSNKKGHLPLPNPKDPVTQLPSGPKRKNLHSKSPQSSKNREILHPKGIWIAATWSTLSYMTNYPKNMAKRTIINTKMNMMMKWWTIKNSHTERMGTAKISTRLATILRGGSSKKSWPRFTSIAIIWSRSWPCSMAGARFVLWCLHASITRLLQSSLNRMIVSTKLLNKRAFKRIQTYSWTALLNPHLRVKLLIHQDIVSIKRRWIASMVD